MHIVERENKPFVTIMPGEFYVSDREVTICTLLGSCIAACLYDPVNRVIGMNHFLLSNRRYARNMPVCLSEAGRYGMHAMELLINEMLKRGAKRQNLQAKAFGGSAFYRTSGVRDNFYCVGDVNIRFIREFLSTDGIPLNAANLGGDIARIIRFQFEDFAVYMKSVGKSMEMSILQQEKQYWQISVDSHDKEQPQVDVWK
jgi:chemotaxis protein CheD